MPCSKKVWQHFFNCSQVYIPVSLSLSADVHHHDENSFYHTVYPQMRCFTAATDIRNNALKIMQIIYCATCQKVCIDHSLPSESLLAHRIFTATL